MYNPEQAGKAENKVQEGPAQAWHVRKGGFGFKMQETEWLNFVL